MKVIKRNGDEVEFDESRIKNAITRAYIEVEAGNGVSAEYIRINAERFTDIVSKEVIKRAEIKGLSAVHVEIVQDQVELVLMRSGEQKVARAYILYRDKHEKARVQDVIPVLSVRDVNGELVPFDASRVSDVILEACDGLDDVDGSIIVTDVMKNIFNGMNESDIPTVMVMSARTLIERDPNYAYVAARLLLDTIREEGLTFIAGKPVRATQADMADIYPTYFKQYIERAVDAELLTPVLLDYDLVRLGKAIKPKRDFQFTYLSIQTLYDRYFQHKDEVRFELPQAFFMRVAMGLAINEDDREGRAIEFYNLLSSFDFMSSTPTLFNSGTLKPQLSSCYLTTVADDLGRIYDAMRDNALLSKFAGGLGNDWTNVRGLGAHIKGTNGQSQGVVPFLKVVNDTAVAVNQGGKRKGAVCAYLETWHIDIEEFLDLRKNTGDDRRRTHDMNTANWVPDLFIVRVHEQKEWTLFSPNDVPDLHDLTGKAFKKAYEKYEKMAARGEIMSRTVKAIDLWRKMLGMIFETGHPWVTFKDPCNIRYTNQHMGVVHSSNLCTEITLHTNDEEIAVCNLGSVNLVQHVNKRGLNVEKLKRTITTAMRMLDNVINYNYYAVPEAENSNLKHRPVGLGIMGFQDALLKQKMSYASDLAVAFADKSMEAVSYFAIEASSNLALERGVYPTYKGSLWSRGILPIDSIELLAEQRDGYLDMDRAQTMDWDALRALVKKQGMRNSNCLAIAPTATISNICGVSQSIEPTYQNLFVKSNLSGEFTVINHYLAQELKELGLWDEVMINDLKYFDGGVQQIDRIPAAIKQRYVTAFEVEPEWLIECASRRQKWLDQAQSLNLYLAKPSGPKLDNIYKLAWIKGLKTTYYLRSMGATAVEKTSTPEREEEPLPQLCGLDGQHCDACE